MMSQLKISEVVKLLVGDPRLIESWKSFCDALKIPAAQTIPWDRDYNRTTLDVSTLFSNIINHWTSSQTRATLDELCVILRDLNFIRVSGELESLGSGKEKPVRIAVETTSSPQDGSGVPLTNLEFGLNRAVANFAGRTRELEELNAKYEHFEGDRIVVVHGTPGIGKSELARKFLDSLSDCSNQGNNKFWIPASSVTTIREAVIALSIQLDIINASDLGIMVGTNTELLISSLMPKVVESVRHSPCIFVFDSVDSEYPEYQTILRTLVAGVQRSKLFIIMTSSSRLTLAGQEHFLKLTEFTDEEAFPFVSESLPRESEESVLELCGYLGNLPIALQQAVAYIRQERTNFENDSFGIVHYLEKLRSEPKIVLSKKIECVSGYPNSTFSTTQIALRRLENGQSAKEGVTKVTLVMQILCLLQPDDIPIKLLKRLYNRFKRRVKRNGFEEAVRLLHTYSLIKRNYTTQAVSMHPLIQSIALMYYKEQGNRVTSVCCQFTRPLRCIVFDNKTTNTFLKLPAVILGNRNVLRNHNTTDRRVLTHIAHVITSFPQVESSVFELSKQNWCYLVLLLVLPSLLIAESLIISLGMVVRTFFVVLAVSMWCSTTWKTVEQIKTEGHLRIMVALGKEYYGFYPEAIQLYLGAHSFLRTIWWDSTYLYVKQRIAACYFGYGDYTTALKMFESTVVQMQQRFGDHHADTLRSTLCLGETLRRLGKHEEALKVFNEVRLWTHENLDTNQQHSHTTFSLIPKFELHNESCYPGRPVSFLVVGGGGASELHDDRVAPRPNITLSMWTRLRLYTLFAVPLFSSILLLLAIYFFVTIVIS